MAAQHQHPVHGTPRPGLPRGPHPLIRAPPVPPSLLSVDRPGRRSDELIRAPRGVHALRTQPSLRCARSDARESLGEIDDGGVPAASVEAGRGTVGGLEEVGSAEGGDAGVGVAAEAAGGGGGEVTEAEALREAGGGGAAAGHVRTLRGDQSEVAHFLCQLYQLQRKKIT